MPSRTDKLKPLKDYLEKEGKASVKEMRGWLSSWSIDGGKLAKSIKSKVIKKNNFYEVTYELEDYFDFVDSGVNGKKKNYEIYTLLKLCVALNVTPNELIEKDDFIETQLK